MNRLRLGAIFLVVLTTICFSGTTVCAEIHHVDDCTVCHYGLGGEPDTSACGGSTNLKMVREEIVTPGNGTRPVAFTGAYVRGGAPYDGICEVCHEDGDVDYHTNTGNGAPHFDGEDCISCHPHRKIYAGKDIFSASDTGLASHHTHMMDQTKGPGSGACTDCHSSTSPPVPGETILFADGNPIATTTACDTCHSDGGAYNGSDMAKTAWGDGIYESGGETLKEGQETWCISCHDSGFSVCKGVSAPNVEPYYTSGHGRPDAGVECLVCHDTAFPHIDGDPRSYWFNAEDVHPADGIPDIYAYANCGVAYAEGYRLRYVDGQVPIMIPIDDTDTFSISQLGLMKSTAYRRCFDSGCHDPFQVFRTNTLDGTTVNYTNFTSLPPDPPQSYGGGSGNSLHEVHRAYFYWDSDWDANTDTYPDQEIGWDAMISCSSCHNVHGAAGIEGSTNEAMIRDGSLAGRTGYGFSYLIEDTTAGGYPWVTSEGAHQSNSVGSVFRNGVGEMCGGCHAGGRDTPPDSSYYTAPTITLYTDVHTGGPSEYVLIVSGAPWDGVDLVDKYIINVTDDQTSGYGTWIVSNTANTITSGSALNWENGD
ncbi:MAG: hypothetical protein SWE60_23220, partial [Thermodesulfobacteriota bacterium]|nr:hypothetical protein [Thermodesulfobacteriota bacterium]